MIDNKYLSDYIINIPIFSNDPTNRNICEYLIKKYRNIIIYCNSQKEGIQINNMINNIQKNSSAYIDCETTKSERNKIIAKYKFGELPFLVNVRILVEGFDAPITKGICFMHMPSSKTTLIQIIGRALRLHEEKKFANIILPFSSNSDEDNINNFLNIMARNDSRIRKSYINKKIGGYIDIVVGEEQKNNENIDEYNNIELKYELIYDKMGVITNSEEIWEKKLKEVKKYIDEYKKRPCEKSKNINIHRMGKWLSHQQHNYKKRQYIMKNNNISKKWKEFINDTNYKQYFLSNKQLWINNLDEIKIYINDNNKIPSQHDKNAYIKYLSNWLTLQKNNYLKQINIMKNKNIRNKWNEFINDNNYKQYFITNKLIWQNNLNLVKKYIDENNIKPSTESKIIDIKKLGKWISTQQKNYLTKNKIMKNKDIRDKYFEFINDIKYVKYFLSNEQEWQNNLNLVKKYINENNKRPSSDSKIYNIKQLGSWILTQQKNYSRYQYIMTNKNIRQKWKDFINDIKYVKYFKYKY